MVFVVLRLGDELATVAVACLLLIVDLGIHDTIAMVFICDPASSRNYPLSVARL